MTRITTHNLDYLRTSCDTRIRAWRKSRGVESASCEGFAQQSVEDEHEPVRCHHHASMGPQQRCCGIEITRPMLAAVIELQWGRSSAAAEFRRSGSTFSSRIWLQWGRSSAAAELATSGAKADVGLGLQWGRSSAAAELSG